MLSYILKFINNSIQFTIQNPKPPIISNYDLIKINPIIENYPFRIFNKNQLLYYKN